MPMLKIPGHEHQHAREVSLEEIRNVLGDCHLCSLCETRTNIVFGDGSQQARVVFVGEAPGASEDAQGIPFVGQAGQLLNRMLSEQTRISRSDVYIANVLKCRPPGNRDPAPDEVMACSPFLREQIRSIWPDVIMPMGNPATHFILQTEVGITRLRGKVHHAGHFIVIPTFHPAAVLRDSNKLNDLEHDFYLLGQILRGEVDPDDATTGSLASMPDFHPSAPGTSPRGSFSSPASDGEPA
jgi:uracil-DNA glycosylase family 4